MNNIMFISTAQDCSDLELEDTLRGHPFERKALLACGYLSVLRSKGISLIPEWVLNLVMCSHDATDLPLPTSLYEAKQLAICLDGFVTSYQGALDEALAEPKHMVQ